MCGVDAEGGDAGEEGVGRGGGCAGAGVAGGGEDLRMARGGGLRVCLRRRFRQGVVTIVGWLRRLVCLPGRISRCQVPQRVQRILLGFAFIPVFSVYTKIKQHKKAPDSFTMFCFELGVWEEDGEATKRMLDADELITSLQLFPRPPACQGLPWTKPGMYLACSLADKGLSGADLQEALGPAARCKSAG